MADLRQACDRCHSKKLRCSKLPGSQTCSRCDKANVACTFSPPARSVRNPVVDDSLDWTSLDNMFGQLPSFSEVTPSLSNGIDQAPSSDIAELSGLTLALDAIHREFPGWDLHHVPMQELMQYLAHAAATCSIHSPLERLLQQTQHLVFLYGKVVKTVAKELESLHTCETCVVTDCSYRLYQSFRDRPRARVDSPSLHLLMACHLRLLDIFDTLLDHGRVCIHVGETQSRYDAPGFDIPEIRTGSFVAPKVSATTILLITLIELQVALTARSRNLASSLSSICESASQEIQILALQCANLRDRSQAMLFDLRALSNRAQDLGMAG